MLGYEADTALRAMFLRASNACSLRFGTQAPAVRLAIHPDDYQLRLSDDLKSLIRSTPATVELEQVADNAPAREAA